MNVYGKISWTLFAMISTSYVYEFRYIKGFKYPVYTTTFCPRNSREYDERSDALNCTGGNSYACLPNESITELWEFCHPLEHIHIPKDRCLFLSTTKLDLESYDCKKFEHGCPDRPYLASTIFEYPSCVFIGNGCFLAEPLCESKENNLSVQEITTQKMAHEKIPANQKIIFISSGIIFGIVIIVSALYYVWISRRKEGKDMNQTCIQGPGKEETPILPSVQDINTDLICEGKDMNQTFIQSPGKEEMSILPSVENINTDFIHEDEDCINDGEMAHFDIEALIKDESDVSIFEGELERFRVQSKEEYADMLDVEKSNLVHACQTGNFHAVFDLLNTDVCVNSCLLDGRSPLHTACEHGHDQIVEFLLDKGADTNIIAVNIGSPLHCACANGRDNIVQLLLNNGADVNLSDNDGFTPLFTACENGRNSIIKLLLDNKAEINICSKDGTSPLRKTCQNGHESTVELLLGNGADVNSVSLKGRSPLSVCCFKGFTSIVKLLLNSNAIVNLCSHDGTSPLFLACRRGHYDIAKLLLNENANTTLCRQDGCSPLDIAKRKRQNKIVNLLTKHSANEN